MGKWDGQNWKEYPGGSVTKSKPAARKKQGRDWSKPVAAPEDRNIRVFSTVFGSKRYSEDASVPPPRHAGSRVIITRVGRPSARGSLRERLGQAGTWGRDRAPGQQPGDLLGLSREAILVPPAFATAVSVRAAVAHLGILRLSDATGRLLDVRQLSKGCHKARSTRNSRPATAGCWLAGPSGFR